MELALKLTVFTLFLVLLQEVFRRSSQWASWSVFLALPVVLSPFWMRNSPDLGVFPWVKLYSVQFTVCWYTGLRYTRLGHSRWARVGATLLLLINIAEAMTQDSFGGHAAHYAVVLSGVLLVVTLPNPLHAIRIGGHGSRDLLYHGMTRAWIVEYTVWNQAFVFLNYPAFAGQQAAVLTSALVVGMVKPERWLQARAHTLGPDLVLLATFPGFLAGWMDTSDWAGCHREDVVAVVSLGIVGSCSARLFFRHRHSSRQQAMTGSGNIRSQS